MQVTRQELKDGRRVFTAEEIAERKILESLDIPDEVKELIVARGIQEVQATWTDADRIRALHRSAGLPCEGDVIPTLSEYVIVRRSRA